MDEPKLTALLTRLGARDAEAWAGSQVREGIPQLARFLFLRQAWRLVVAENDTTWIQEQAAVESGEPGAAIAPAIQRLLALGATVEDLTTVARVMQWQLLFRLCYLLDDPGDVEDEVRDVTWRLFQVDENNKPVAIIGGLHESVLETEPSGREMRPWSKAK
jgi:hypothetical protein